MSRPPKRSGKRTRSKQKLRRAPKVRRGGRREAVNVAEAKAMVGGSTELADRKAGVLDAGIASEGAGPPTQQSTQPTTHIIGETKAGMRVYVTRGGTFVRVKTVGGMG